MRLPLGWHPVARHQLAMSRGDRHGRLEPETAHQILVGVDAPVAQERPVAAGLFDTREIALDHHRLFAIVRGGRDYLAEWIGDKRTAPEIELIFHADPVRRGDEKSV